MSQRTESSRLCGASPREEGWPRGGRLPGEGIMGSSVGRVVDSGLVQAGETAGGTQPGKPGGERAEGTPRF